MSRWLASVIETLVLMTVLLIPSCDPPLNPNAAADSKWCHITEKNEICARSTIHHYESRPASRTSVKPLGKSSTPFFL